MTTETVTIKGRTFHPAAVETLADLLPALRGLALAAWADGRDEESATVTKAADEIERLQMFVQSVADFSNDPHLRNWALDLGARP